MAWNEPETGIPNLEQCWAIFANGDGHAAIAKALLIALRPNAGQAGRSRVFSERRFADVVRLASIIGVSAGNDAPTHLECGPARWTQWIQGKNLPPQIKVPDIFEWLSREIEKKYSQPKPSSA